MEIVLDKGIISELFRTVAVINSERKHVNLKSCIQNDDVSIKISDNYINFLSDYFEDKDTQEAIAFKDLITYLQDKDRIISYSPSEELIDENDELEKIFNYNLNDITFLLTKVRISISDENKSIERSISIYDEIFVSNRNWIINELLTGNTIRINNRIIKTNNDFEKLINTFRDFLHTNKTIHIIDNYFNCYSTCILQYLKGNGIKIKCYTARTTPNKTIESKRSAVQTTFGKRTSLKTCSDSNVTHPRKIIIEDIEILSNHDFSYLLLSANNWDLYIQASKEIKQRNIQALNQYRAN